MGADESPGARPTSGIAFENLWRRSEALIVVAQIAVDGAQDGGRNGVMRIGLRPQLTGLAGCLQVPGGVSFIMRGDVELFALAYPFAQFVRLAGILGGAGGLAQVGIGVP